MWAWYLEWSRIARSAIKQRALLRQLGFLQPSRAGAAEEGTDVEDGAPAAADKKAKTPA